jgi:heat shock protein beta
VFGEQKELEINIISGKESKHISFTDVEIEMTRAQFISNLVKFSRSRTWKFMQAIEEETDFSSVCKFSVGFISSFLFADKVVVTSKHNDDD